MAEPVQSTLTAYVPVNVSREITPFTLRVMDPPRLPCPSALSLPSAAKSPTPTKVGFEFNHGSKYWFNFAQAEDDIVAPKSNTRGEVYETYLTHRINDHFIFKADFMRYNYTWSGSGWHLGAPKRLNSTPLLGFPTYDTANMFTMGLVARF